MTKTILSLLFILFLCITQVQAGWYECYTYKGSISKYPITLSIQVRDGFFGEKDKKDFNLIGVYKYDAYNTPIRLEGKLNRQTKKVVLYEVNDQKQRITFEFEFSEKMSTGVWKNLSTQKTFPLHLNYVSKLIELTPESAIVNNEVLQTNSLENYYFIGIYSKQPGEDRVHMDKLKIINKKDNTLFQIIDFSSVETQTGNIKTIVYDNVEVYNPHKKEFLVWNDIGRMGGYLTVAFNPKTQKFELDPEPQIDGPE
ncbi:hypothetical protein [Xanthocytophaga flava]|uniref:hypothetical protein n=1 Tax=Xanthocytophaga flava TaxID=3048013 RepID=UPI0028D01CD8|nr:hypothetical protein [Xanthocytophaga flavus]MDJ1470412.1 hypothetical protein [Xanthocytophaga flavus]